MEDTIAHSSTKCKSSYRWICRLGARYVRFPTWVPEKADVSRRIACRRENKRQDCRPSESWHGKGEVSIRAARKISAGTAVPAFNDIFLKSVRKRGRVYELGLMAAFKLRTGRLFEDAAKAPMMLSKGKLPLLGNSVSGRAHRKAMFRRAIEGGAR